MSVSGLNTRVVADVKCYHCGHISGQIFGYGRQPLRISDFVPRKGYTGPDVKAGTKLRCERCSGPVFLEDATAGLPLSRRMKRRPEELQPQRAA